MGQRKHLHRRSLRLLETVVVIVHAARRAITRGASVLFRHRRIVIGI
jgi:hypothetical protein